LALFAWAIGAQRVANSSRAQDAGHLQEKADRRKLKAFPDMGNRRRKIRCCYWNDANAVSPVPCGARANA